MPHKIRFPSSGQDSQEKIQNILKMKDIESEEHPVHDAKGYEEEADDESPITTWQQKWKQKIQDELLDILRGDVLFGIFFANEGDSFSRGERIFNLLGFIGTQIMIMSMIGIQDAVIDATCACLQNEESSEAFCHETGNVTFSLPESGGLREEEWDPYVKTWSDSITEAYASCPTDATVSECSATKFCCYAYVGNLLGEEEKDSWHGMSPADPCPEYWFANIVLGSIYGVLLSYLILSPVVVYLLSFESRRCNPVAYLLVVVQVGWGIVMVLYYTHASGELGVSNAAWVTVLTNLAVGLFITSPIVGLVVNSFAKRLLRKVGGCCCCCCCKCCKKDSSKEDADEEDITEKRAITETEGVEKDSSPTIQKDKTPEDPGPLYKSASLKGWSPVDFDAGALINVEASEVTA